MGINRRHTFRDILARQYLRIECRKCGRFGRYRVDRLIERYGLDAPVSAWGDALTKDCPRRADLAFEQRCFGPSYPDLQKLLYDPV